MALVAYTHYRLYITKNSLGNNGYFAINELGLFEDADSSGVDLCLGAVASASNTNGAYVAANAIDGVPSTVWETTSASGDKWFSVQLPSAKAIRSLYLSSTTWGGECPRDFLIQGSNDGTNWTTIVAFNDFVTTTSGFSGYAAFNLSIGGISKLDTGDASLRVLLHNWTTGQLVAAITPKPNGEWNYRPRSTADLLVTHIGPSGYQPRSDGPITPYAE